MKIKLPAIVLIILCLATCTKDSYNTTPTLKFESVNATEFPQQAVVKFNLTCTDKEGDVVDTIWVQRISKVAACSTLVSGIDSFPIPDFHPTKNVRADFQFSYTYAGAFAPNLQACTIGNSESTTDTSYFRFWMHDKAQHISDTVQSPDLVFLKQQ
jgi:hypothetical protein